MFKRLLRRLSRRPEPRVVPVIPVNDLTDLNERFDLLWEQLPPRLRTTAVEYLRENVADLDVIRGWIEEDPENWYVRDQNVTMQAIPIEGPAPAALYLPMPFHFHGGMAVRNLLRKVIRDDELPSGNWDDYYVQALEAAAGKRVV